MAGYSTSGRVILHDQPLNDVFILYLLNIRKNNHSKLLKNERTNERTNEQSELNKKTSVERIDQPLNDVFYSILTEFTKK